MEAENSPDAICVRPRRRSTTGTASPDNCWVATIERLAKEPRVATKQQITRIDKNRLRIAREQPSAFVIRLDRRQIYGADGFSFRARRVQEAATVRKKRRPRDWRQVVLCSRIWTGVGFPPCDATRIKVGWIGRREDDAAGRAPGTSARVSLERADFSPLARSPRRACTAFVRRRRQSNDCRATRRAETPHQFPAAFVLRTSRALGATTRPCPVDRRHKTRVVFRRATRADTVTRPTPAPPSAPNECLSGGGI